MAYTRIYPMAAVSYLPSNNPLRKQSASVTVTAGSGNLTTVRSDYVSLVTTPADWFCTITSGKDRSICSTYRISAKPTATSLTLLQMDGSAFNPPVGSTDGKYSIELFKNTAPSENEAIPTAFYCTTQPTTKLKIITGDGQYAEILKAAIVVGAIYNISISKIVDLDSAVGYLLSERGYASNIR